MYSMCTLNIQFWPSSYLLTCMGRSLCDVQQPATRGGFFFRLLVVLKCCSSLYTVNVPDQSQFLVTTTSSSLTYRQQSHQTFPMAFADFYSSLPVCPGLVGHTLQSLKGLLVRHWLGLGLASGSDPAWGSRCLFFWSGCDWWALSYMERFLVGRCIPVGTFWSKWSSFPRWCVPVVEPAKSAAG